ncbi:hypothetical protein BALH_4745 [Bacillus thuringiensis str. Al Hakam]|nr:hypothetical protein BALH_4745 [Bacillus thuringiensis str. Al Hakam]
MKNALSQTQHLHIVQYPNAYPAFYMVVPRNKKSAPSIVKQESKITIYDSFFRNPSLILLRVPKKRINFTPKHDIHTLFI